MAFVPFTGELDPPEKRSSQFVPFTGELDPPEKQASQFVPFTGELDSDVKSERFTPYEEPYEVKTENPFKGLVGRAAELTGSGIEAVAEIGERLGDKLELALPLSNLTPEQVKNEQQLKPLFDWARSLKDYGKDIGYSPSTKLSDLAENPLTAVPFITERIVTSVPDMAASVINLPAYVGARTKEILDERVKNDGKTLDDATVSDVTAAAGAAIIEGTLERFASKRVLSGAGKTASGKTASGRIAKETGTQAGTEFVEEVAAYSGETAGTKRGFDVEEAGLAGLEGMIVGGGFGAGVQTTKEGLTALQKQQETQELKDLEKLSDQEKVVTTSEDKVAPVFDQLVDQYKAEGATEAEAFKLAGQAILVQRLDDVSKGAVDVTDTEAEPGAGEPSVSVPSGEGTVSEPAPGVERVEPAGVAAVGDISSGVGGTEGAGVPSLDAAIQARANELIAEAADLGATIPMDVAVERATTELTETVEPDVTSEVITATPTETTTAELATTPATTAPATAASPQTPKFGFKTEKGSVYSVDEQNKTSRTKMSEGEGKGTTYDPHAVLYVSPEDAKSVLSDMQSGALDKSASVRLGYVDTKNNVFKSVKDVSEIPAEAEPLVATVDKKKNQVITFYKAKLNPAIGLSPIEKLYTPDGMANTHIGNKIVELFGQTESTTTPSSTPATTTTPAETKLKPQGKPRGRKPVVRTPEEQAEAEAQRKQRQAIGRDAIREADKAQAVITREFNLDDYATEDAAKASALELLQERQGALVAAYNTMANKSLAPNSKAKQTAQAVINHESVTDKERRDAKARIAATEQTTARSDLLTGATNQDLDATYLVEDFGTATKAIEYIMRTGSAFEKLLAQRIKPFLKGVKLVIVNNPERDIPNAKLRRKFRGATGMYAETAKGERTIYLSNIANLEGISNMTFLHEAVHGATMAQINAYIKNPNSVSPQVREAIKSMNDIMLKAYAYYAVLKAGGRSVRGIDSIALDDMDKLKVFIDLKEFVAYGLTQPEMQQFLSAIPGNYGSSNKYGAFNKFIDAIRKIFNLGPQYKSAFIDLVAVTDQLLSARGPVPSKNTIIAAANKVAKQNKTLNKVKTTKH
jgi:hypothetical protein